MQIIHKLLLVSMLSISPATVAPPKPQVLLKVLPSFATHDPFHGKEVTALLIIRNFDAELWCPEIEWEWNGERSSQLSDCVPFEEAEAGEKEFWSETRQRRFYAAGIVHVQVKLLKGGKILRRATARMTIMER